MTESRQIPHVVLVLAAEAEGLHTRLASACCDFLQAVHQDIRFTLLIDQRTASCLKRCRSSLVSRFDDVVVDHHREQSAKAASRALKIRSRELVGGDFIYLDCDAFVISRIDGALGLPGDVGFAIDLGLEREAFESDNLWCVEHRQLGWHMTKTHRNGGVFFARDNDRSRAFFATWWRRWREFQAVGRCVDQPALDQAVQETDAEVAMLPPRYNTTFCVDPRQLRSAAVLHFLVSQGTLVSTVLRQILAEVRDEGRVRPTTISQLRATRYPWRDVNQPRRQYYAGNYIQAIRATMVRGWSMVTARRGRKKGAAV